VAQTESPQHRNSRKRGGNGHFGSLTFDKVKNDQAIGFRYLESDNGTYQTGLELWQRPNLPPDVAEAKYEAASKIPDEAARKAAIQAMIDNNEITTQRLFLGKGRNNTTSLILYDIKGKPRITMSLAADANPKLDFLDKTGKVIYSLPKANKADKK